MAESTALIIVQNVPYKVPVTDSSGLISAPWSKWFRQLYDRVGGTIAPSNSQLSGGSLIDLSTLETQVTHLQSQVAALQVNINDINQGRRL